MNTILEIKSLCSLPEEIIRHILLSGLSLQTLLDVIMTLNPYYYNLVANLLKFYTIKLTDVAWIQYNNNKRMYKFYNNIGLITHLKIDTSSDTCFCLIKKNLYECDKITINNFNKLLFIVKGYAGITKYFSFF